MIKLYKIGWYELGNGRKCELQHHLGENTIKRAKGAKVEVLFQGLHMTCVTFVLVYNFKICISSTPFSTTF